MATFLQETQTSGNRRIWTWSCWVKRCETGTSHSLMNTRGSDDDRIQFHSSDVIRILLNGSASSFLVTNRLYRDVNAWYHIVVSVDTTQSTAANRIKLYVNGVQETSFSTENYPSQNYDTFLNNSNTMTVGGVTGGAETLNGSMSHIHYIDGTAYDASAFGETDATTGIWKPKTAPSVTYGTNGFFLKFENSGSMGTDSSGNANNFTVNGTMTQNIDTPSNVFATFNPLDVRSSGGTSYPATYSDGNLTAEFPSGAIVNNSNSSIAFNQGKWYCEIKITNVVNTYIGILPKDDWNSTTWPVSTVGYSYKATDGDKRSSAGEVAYGNSYTSGDIVQIAFDCDNGTLWFGKNGTWQNSATQSEIENGTTTNSAYSGLTSAKNWVFFYSGTAGTPNDKASANFGNGYFGTTAVSSAQNPDDGIGIFEYAVPSGYKALCTKSINAQEYD